MREYTLQVVYLRNTYNEFSGNILAFANSFDNVKKLSQVFNGILMIRYEIIKKSASFYDNR